MTTTRAILTNGDAVLTLGVFYASGTSHAATQYQPQALNPVTERLWNGEAPAEIEALVEQLNPLVSEHPDLFGGVALSHDRQSVELFVANPDFATLAPDIGEIYTAHKDSVNITNVEHSLSELIALQNTVHALVAHSRTSHSSIDVMNNVVKVSVDNKALAEKIENQFAKENATPLVIEQISEGEFAAGRYDDFPRYYMEGAIVSPQNSTCSLGIPIVVRGTRGVLTAGHCTGSTWRTPTGRLVGSTYTTTYPGNANRFGDWKILSGSAYGTRTFNGPANSSNTSSRSMVGVGSPWVGQPACHSGQRTGQICRYFVESINAQISLEGVIVNNVAILYHDGNVDGVKDSNGFLKGDSGGPIYTHSNAQGADLAYGIVTGYYTASDGHRRYAFTKFDGVLQWDPSIRFGE